MAVRFDPRIISEDERAALNRPASPGLPHPPPADVPRAAVTPPPRPTEDFPHPPTRPPPMRHRKRDITLPLRPSG